MPLLLDIGHSSFARRRDSDRKQCLAELPRTAAEEDQLALVALAESLPGRPEPEQAAHNVVSVFHQGWRAAPETWAPAKSLQECFAASNQFLAGSGNPSCAASLSTLILHQRRWLVGHAGITRVWLYRDQRIKLLTRDHQVPGYHPVPQFSKAVGIGPTLDPDIAAGDVQEGDIFVLTTGGVHGVLDSATIMSCLMGELSAQQMAETLLRRAQGTTKADNLHACVVHVERLPPKAAERDSASLSMITPPMIGDTVDGFHIEELVQKSSRFRLYRASDAAGTKFLLKFPNPRYGDDAAFVDEFLREEWIARRLDNPSLTHALPLERGRRTALYSVFENHAGEDLSSRVKRGQLLSVAEALPLAMQLLETVALLRRAGVNHPDIRPKNLLLDGPNRRWVLLNGGTSLLGVRRKAQDNSTTPSGALSYLAPELLEGRDAGECTDVYIVGAVLWRLLTSKYPYGKIKSVNHAAFGALDTAVAQKANVPLWLVDVLSRACAFDPDGRYANTHAFLRALADGEKRATQQSAATPVAAAPAAAAPARRIASREWLIVGALVAGLVVYVLLVLT